MGDAHRIADLVVQIDLFVPAAGQIGYPAGQIAQPAAHTDFPAVARTDFPAAAHTDFPAAAQIDFPAISIVPRW